MSSSARSAPGEVGLGRDAARGRASGARAESAGSRAGRSSSGELWCATGSTGMSTTVLAVPAHAHAPVVGDAPDHHGVEVPALRRSSQHLALAARRAPRAACAPGSPRAAARTASCPDSRCGTRSRSSSMPVPALLAISNDEQVRPAAPMSWMPTIASVRISSRHASIRHFSVKGSPTCTVGRFASLVVVELRRREQARAVDAVAAGLAADVDHRVADARRPWRGRRGRPRRRRG